MSWGRGGKGRRAENHLFLLSADNKALYLAGSHGAFHKQQLWMELRVWAVGIQGCPSCSLPRGSTRAPAGRPPPLPFRGGSQPAPRCFRFRFSGLSSHPWWANGKRGGWKGPQAAPAPGGLWQGCWGLGAAVGGVWGWAQRSPLRTVGLGLAMAQGQSGLQELVAPPWWFKVRGPDPYQSLLLLVTFHFP